MHYSTAIISALALFAPLVKGTEYADPENILLNLEFEDRNIDPWYMSYPGDDFDFFMDIQSILFPDNQFTKALRVGEVTLTTGIEAKVKWRPKVRLEAGATYQIAFCSRSSLIGDESVGHQLIPGLGSDFSSLQFAVFNRESNVFSVRPGKGINLGMEWFRWHYRFTVEESQAGTAYFGFIVTSSGHGVDWWFDDISLIKV
ncbi:hypothetical protein B0T10DRAFT_490304 [Thelonectria olida]|uniref:NPH3 domain-containing protein n=1 Tax=Thelonectria olida TaxID=1576542 RepID=A0A9P9AKV8_9HYPO|nr:hypothetical protein B0T10DRAFT_490304 [Thelonectria olida]